MMQKIIDWYEIYQQLDLDMDVYIKINSGENFNSSMILKDECVEDDS